MSLKDDLLPLVDDLRSIAATLGFRPYQVWVRTTTWSGTRVGLGTETSTETRLLVGGQDPKVRVVRTKDVVAGTLELKDAEYDIGPLTPSFSGGGIADSTIDPQHTSTPTEIMFLLKGPGLPSNGLLCKREHAIMDHTLRRVVRVKGTGRAKP